MSDVDQATFDGFTLAVRVMLQAFDIEAPGTDYEKPWALLREIAEGSATLTAPGEMAARFPHLRDFVYDRVNRVIESDRETAQRVLRGLSTAY